MCGIAGILYFDSQTPVDPRVLQRMTRVLRHRGPDDEGYHFGPGIGLGNRRLSIVDVEGGHQPMANEDGSLWITLNGEIYNHADFRDWLANRGHRFQTRADTEVVLHLYEEYGSECPRRLNGIFGFALWDEPRRRLLLARDHLGVKPLYYYSDGRLLLFASEIKALLEFPGFASQLDEQAVAEYFHFGTPWGPRTFFRGVRLLEPGHILIAEKGELHEKCYWNVDYSPDRRAKLSHEGTALEELRSLLEGAVKGQLMSDVPVGCFLSGGIDSSVLTVLASRHYSEKLHVFSAAFDPGSLYDETPYAATVAKQAGAEHHSIYLEPDEFRSVLPRLIWHLDEPRIGASIFPQFYVSRLARQHVKVCLGGQGGDELFGGYARYALAEPWKNAARFAWSRLRPRRSSSAVAANVHKQFDTGVAWWLLRHWGSLFKSWQQRYLDQFLWMSPSTRGQVLAPGFLESIGQHRALDSIDEIMAHCRFPDPFSKTSYLETKTYLNGLLILEDRMSMANSLESRVPLLDYRLAELALHLPAEFKVRGLTSKYLFKKSVENWLPPDILNKRKLGFPVPIGPWFKNSLKSWVKEVLLDPKSLQRGYLQRRGVEALLDRKLLRYDRYWERVVWGLLNFELWHRIFIDKPGPDFTNTATKRAPNSAPQA